MSLCSDWSALTGLSRHSPLCFSSASVFAIKALTSHHMNRSPDNLFKGPVCGYGLWAFLSRINALILSQYSYCSVCFFVKKISKSYFHGWSYDMGSFKLKWWILQPTQWTGSSISIYLVSCLCPWWTKTNIHSLFIAVLHFTFPRGTHLVP